MWTFISALCALVVTLALVPLWLRLAPRLGAVDHPRDRHQHEQPTPTAGGVVIFVGVWLPVAVILLLRSAFSLPLVGLLIATGLLVFLNVHDDIRGLPPLGRLTAQLVLAALAYVWGVRVEGIGNLGGLLGADPWIELGLLAAPLTVLWIVFVTNGLNWLDGLDGLAAGVAAISAITFAAMATFSRTFADPTLGIVAGAITWACLGFLRYNFAPARVFMGDTGAMFLGFMLASLAVVSAFKVPTAAAVFLPVLLLGVPLGDSTHAIVKRVLSGRNPLVWDRGHIHHRLLDRGYTVVQAVLLVYAVAGILCLVSIGLWLR